MKSMTGYGVEYSGGISCWIKSLNSRFLEIYFSIPHEFIDIESDMSREIRKRVKRGKVEVFIRNDEKFITFFRRKNKDKVFSVFLSALQKFEESREQEGEFIKQDLRQRINRIKEIIENIERIHTSTFPSKVKESLRERVQQIALEIGIGDIPNDIIDKAGVVHIIRKSDISEEITRVKSHLYSFEDELEGEGDGKKLMFISQEIMRELNTMGAKSLDVSITEKVIEAKLEIERIREQLYNVE